MFRPRGASALWRYIKLNQFILNQIKCNDEDDFRLHSSLVVVDAIVGKSFFREPDFSGVFSEFPQANFGILCSPKFHFWPNLGQHYQFLREIPDLSVFQFFLHISKFCLKKKVRTRVLSSKFFPTIMVEAQGPLLLFDDKDEYVLTPFSFARSQ